MSLSSTMIGMIGLDVVVVIVVFVCFPEDAVVDESIRRVRVGFICRSAAERLIPRVTIETEIVA